MKKVIAYFNNPLLKLPLLFGFITGILCFGFFLALYAVGVPPLGNQKSLDFGIHLIMMTAAVWYYRKRIGHGLLHLWEGLTICYLINTIAALVTGWLIYFFIAYIDPAVFSRYLDSAVNQIVADRGRLLEKLGKAEYLTLLKNIRATDPGDLITDEIVKKTLIAVIPILIISLIFRKQDYSVYNP